MYVPVTIFTNKDEKRKEITSDVTKHHQRKEEDNISKPKVQNSQLGFDKKIVQDDKYL